jgi:hypothetical protein
MVCSNVKKTVYCKSGIGKKEKIMQYSKIKTAEEMVDYLIDCTLATVDRMIDKKSIPKSEFNRQCGIAQKGIDFLGPKYPYTGRAEDVIAARKQVVDYYLEQREKYLNKNKQQKVIE